MRISLFAIVAVFGTIARAVPTTDTRNTRVLHEKREVPLKKWVKRDALHPSTILPVRIGLTQRNLEEGHHLLMELSDMNSPKYGQHLSPQEVVDFFAPDQAAVDSVKEWLVSSGFATKRISHSLNKLWIQFSASVGEIEELLHTKYHRYEHVHSGREGVGCEQYHVPEHITHHIDFITPGLKILQTRDDTSKTHPKLKGHPPVIAVAISSPPGISDPAVQLQYCDSQVYPACISTMYNITEAQLAAPINMMGIFEEGDFYVPSDLDQFFTNFFPSIPNGTYPSLEGIDGGYAPMPSSPYHGESDLDFQVAYPIVYPQSIVLFQTDDFQYTTTFDFGNGLFNTFFDAIDGSYCTYSAFGETGDDPSEDPQYPDPSSGGYKGALQCGVYNPTNVISMSYGEGENSLPTNYQQRQCSEMMKLGMQGITLVVASGDYGVSAGGGTHNLDGCLGDGEVFAPDFPATCPYITAVGATTLPPDGNVYTDAETAVTSFGSGGGFSNIYPTPQYQGKAVFKYLLEYSPPYPFYNLTTPNSNPGENETLGGYYNVGGRGYPDVSAVGHNVVSVSGGNVYTTGGTSASAPIFASIINRINEERIAAGMPTVGFINPTLYKHPHAFHDITVGNNSGCGTNGFSCSKGWDPVTGLGTPNYPALLKVFMNPRTER